MGGDANSAAFRLKTIIPTSRLYAEMRNAENFGARVPGEIKVDFPAVMERMRRIRARISRSRFGNGTNLHGRRCVFWRRALYGSRTP